MKQARWALLPIMLFGLAVRLIGIGSTPFQFGDDISTAWAAVWYFPRGLSSFVVGNHSLEPNPLGVITLAHGPLQAVIAMAWAWAASTFGFALTEATWHLPFAILGAATIPVVFMLGRELSSTRAGLIAAAFVAALPLHVAFSRTSGESHYILATLLQSVALWLWVRHLRTGGFGYALFASLAVAADMLTDVWFVGILVIMGLAVVAYRLRGPVPRLSDASIPRRAYLALVVPLTLPAAVYAYGLWQTLKNGNPVGMVGRVLSSAGDSSTRVGGFFLIAALGRLAYVSNALFLIVGAIVVVTAIARLRPVSWPKLLPLAWAVVYLLPLVFLVNRERLEGHFIAVAVAASLATAIAIDELFAGKSKVFATALAIGLELSLVLTMLSMVWGSNTGTLFQRPIEHGGIGIDRGVKAVGWWIRHNTPLEDIVFADPLAGQSLTLALYYYHRPVLSEDLSFQTSWARSLDQLGRNVASVSVIVVGAEHLHEIPAGIARQFAAAAEVYNSGQLSVCILVRHPAARPPQRLDVEQFDKTYDEQYASLREEVNLPLQQLHQAGAVLTP
jgi:hypothetical protein